LSYVWEFMRGAREGRGELWGKGSKK